MKPLTRRSVTTGLAAAVTAIPTLAFPGVAQPEPGTTDLLRSFIRKLLTQRSRLTAGEWVERKRLVRGLQAMINDHIEPWEPWEEELKAEMDSRRGTVWAA